MKNTVGASSQQIYSVLTSKFNLTSKQSQSIVHDVESKYKTIKELKKYELEQLTTSIEKRNRFILAKQKDVLLLEKKIVKNKNIKLLNKKDKSYYNSLRIIEIAQIKIKFYNSWINQKKKVLVKKQSNLIKLEKIIKLGKFSICFGGKKLFHQRPTQFNKNVSSYDNLKDWKNDWNLARNNFIYSIGATDRVFCNPEFHYNIDKKSIRIRLPNDLADMRMKALEKELNLNFIEGKSDKDCNLRMQCESHRPEGWCF